MFKKVETMLSCLLLIIFSVIMIPVKVLAAGETDSNSISSGKTYIITSKNSGKTMEVSNFGTQNGDGIQQWDYGNSENQQWIIEEVGERYYKIISKISGKVISVKDSATKNGTAIYQWDFIDGNHQLWYFEKTDDGYFKIKSKQSNKCIDISGISKDNGASMQLWDDVNGDNQKWKIEEIEDEKDNDECIIVSKNSNKVLDVENNSNQNGALIQQYDYNGQDNQKWSIKYIDNKYFYIKSKSSNKVIDVRNRDTQNGSVVYQWEYNGQDNQLWYLEKDNRGYYKIKSKQTNKCLDVMGISQNNNAKIQIWDDVNGDNQKWSIKKINSKEDGEPLNFQIEADKDYDGDGIINSEEDEIGTNMFLSDSDKDGVNDYDEIYIYKTNPLLEDTDQDTINDYCEIKLGLDPLTKNNVEDQYSYNVDINELGVNVNVKGNPMAVSTTRIEKVEDDFLSSIPNTLGNIIEFSSKSSIDSADVTIKYDENELKSKGLNEDNLSIYYINETDLKLEKINTIIDKNNKILTCELNHFSKYLVGDSSKIISDLTAFDIIFAIDKSGSMAWSDSESKRIDVCKNLVNDDTFRKQSYRFGIVSFDSDATPTTFKDSETTYLTNNHSYVIDKLEDLRGVALGGTNFADAINIATNMFRDNKRKIIILLTDGDQTSGNINYAVNKAKENDVQIYTVGLGNEVNVSVLRDKIANKTGGKYFHADDADSLYQCFEELTKNIGTRKEEQIYYKDKCVKVKLVCDSGFDAERNGYSFENYSYKDNGGTCFGISVTSILYYLNKLPFDSTKSKDFASKKSDEYNVSNISDFKLGKQLNDIKLKYQYFNIDCTEERDNHKLSEFNLEDQEIIKMNNWWHNIQADSIRNALTTFSTWSSSDIKSIYNIINTLKERPIQLFYMGFSGGHFSSHALVAEKLYKSTTQTDVYYLKVYNPNYPNAKDYIKISQEILLDPINPSIPRVVLSFEDPSADYDDIYMATNPIKLLNKTF